MDLLELNKLKNYWDVLLGLKIVNRFVEITRMGKREEWVGEKMTM